MVFCSPISLSADFFIIEVTLERIRLWLHHSFSKETARIFFRHLAEASLVLFDPSVPKNLLYVAPGQTVETQILSSVHGPPAYTRFQFVNIVIKSYSRSVRGVRGYENEYSKLSMPCSSSHSLVPTSGSCQRVVSSSSSHGCASSPIGTQASSRTPTETPFEAKL